MILHRGEFWNPELQDCRNFLDTVDYRIDLFDVSLHYKLQTASKAGRSFDLRTIFDDTLVQSHPMNAVTFVDNHDSRPQESLESWVEDWFKQSAYALILAKGRLSFRLLWRLLRNRRRETHSRQREAIGPLLYARANRAYGQQDDYFDHPNTIGCPSRHPGNRVFRSR